MLNQHGFDLWADGYDRSVQLSDESNTYPFAGYKALLARVYEQVMTHSHNDVLDLGFGTAVLTARLYQQGCRIAGQDFSARMIALARSRMPDALLCQGDLAEGIAPALASRRYDVILSTYAVHHLTDGQKITLIRHLTPLLKPDGILLIGDVAFPTVAARAACRTAAGDDWDEDEFYFVFDEIAPQLPPASFEQISPCAGILTIRP